MEETMSRTFRRLKGNHTALARSRSKLADPYYVWWEGHLEWHLKWLDAFFSDGYDNSSWKKNMKKLCATCNRAKARNEIAKFLKDSEYEIPKDRYQDAVDSWWWS